MPCGGDGFLENSCFHQDTLFLEKMIVGVLIKIFPANRPQSLVRVSKRNLHRVPLFRYLKSISSQSFFKY
jgi:hypothetical protein